MSVEKEKVRNLIIEFGNNDNDTGSTKAQIAIFTERINNITNHLKLNKKDRECEDNFNNYYEDLS